MLRFTFLIVSVLSVFAAIRAQAQTPLDSAFTYQGELAGAGTPAAGTYDIRFRLYDAATGGTQIGSTLCSDDLAVANGRFAASLDFGAAAFAGQKRFLEIEVRQDTGLDCLDATGYTVLSPRQELTAAPNATFAQNAATAISATTATTATNATSLNGQSASFFQNAANLTGTLSDAQLSSNIARLNSNQTFTGLLNFTNAGNTFAGNGAGLTNLNGGSISVGTVTRSSLSADVQSGLGTLVPDLSLSGGAATGINPNSVAVSGLFAYVANVNSNTLQVFSISNLGVPTLAGSVATGITPVSVAVSGSFAYVVNQSSDTLQVFNIGNPAAPTLAGSVTTSFPRFIAVSGSFAYVVASNTLQVFNISNPAAPTLAGSVATALTPFSVAVSGSFAYVVNQVSSTLQVFNISNPAAPTLAASVATGNIPSSVAVSGSFAYVVSQGSNTLQVFNIGNPAAPSLVGSVTTGSFPVSVTVSSSFAYVANRNSDTLQVFTISNPAAPTLARSIATASGPTSVAVSGSFAYVVNSNSNTLQVFNTRGVGFGTPLAASSLNLSGINGSGLTSVNAAHLNGQDASFYTNASNITTGTLGVSRIPTNFAREDAANAFGNFTNTFAGNVGIGITTPTSRLHVRGDGTGGRLAIDPGASNLDSEIGLYENLSNSLGAILRYNGSVTNQFQIVGVTSGVELTLATFDRDGTGSVNVPVTFSAASKAFRIDHPLDPMNKELWHSCVESPDMKNIYDGVVTTDDRGYATVVLPDYFQALNRDFRYQLTIIDEADDTDIFLWAKVVREVKDNQFTLRSSHGHLKVSWQVTGVRQDAWAEKNRIPGSVDKTPAEKGKYLHPEAFGKPVTQGVYFAPSTDMRRENK